MFRYQQPLDRTVHVFSAAGGTTESFFVLSTSLSCLVENEDANFLYMNLLWNTVSNVKWKPKRFNTALTWLFEHRCISSAVYTMYIKQDKVKEGLVNGRTSGTHANTSRDSVSV